MRRVQSDDTDIGITHNMYNIAVCNWMLYEIPCDIIRSRVVVTLKTRGSNI